MGRARQLLGIDIGGTSTTVVVGDGEGRVLEKKQWPTGVERGPKPILDEIVTAARELLDVHSGAVAAGVAIGGPLDAEGGVIYGPPNLPGWEALPLRDILEEALGLPVAIEHDAAACALAEHRWGAGRGSRRLAYLTCGSGFGVGLVFDGRPYRGALGRSLELGHVRYRDDGPVSYGKRGCFEAYAAGNSLPKLAAWSAGGRWARRPPAGDELSRLAMNGDEDARRVLDLNARAVGDACAVLGDLLLLDAIVLGSLARYLGEPWIERVRWRFEEQVLPWVAGSCRIMAAGLGDRLGDCAALVVASRKSARGCDD